MKKPKTPDFGLKSDRQVEKLLKKVTHVYHHGALCETDGMGYPTPDNRAPEELVVDASQGFVPLWDRRVTLRWRFQESSLIRFLDPAGVKRYVRELFGRALLAWEDAVPVRFTEAAELWDFELVVRAEDSCNPMGCTLARAFFPDAGQHELVLFPRMFGQPYGEQIETMAHELGHVFGLRHFFAQLSESTYPSEIFGTHSKFSIMNYGPDSRLTRTDLADLKTLYEEVWSGRLTELNGTPIELVRPFSHFHDPYGRPELLALAPSSPPRRLT